MLVPDAGVSEDAKLAFAALSTDAKHRQFCAGRIACALTFVSFLARVLRPAHELTKAAQRRQKSRLRRRGRGRLTAHLPKFLTSL